MLVNHFQLLRPWWMLALIPLSLMLVRLWRNASVTHHWQTVCDPQLLPYLLTGTKHSRRQSYVIALGICWLCSVIALSGPTWQRLPLSVYKAQQAQVVVLDLTDNMEAADIRPNRLMRARYKLLDILHQSKEQQTGLVVFTGKAFVVSPLTQDAQTIAAMVPALTSNIVPVQGQDIGAALIKAAELFKQAGIYKGQIILITASKPTQEAERIAAKLHKKGFSVSILGVGTELGAPISSSEPETTTALARLDRPGLERLAVSGGGRYVQFDDTDADINILLHAADPTFADSQKTTQTIEIWIDQGYWWILPVLFIAACLFRRGWSEELT